MIRHKTNSKIDQFVRETKLPYNWPPSRGARPFSTKIVYRSPKVELTDIGPSSEENKCCEGNKYKMWVRVADLVSCPPEVAHKLVRGLSEDGKHIGVLRYGKGNIPPSFKVGLAYPFKRPSFVTIAPIEGESDLVECSEQSLGLIVWGIAQGYKIVYEQHEKYGVWGHGIEDLMIENLTIDGDCVCPFIGS